MYAYVYIYKHIGKRKHYKQTYINILAYIGTIYNIIT